MSAKDDGADGEPKRRRAPAKKRARSKAGKTTRAKSGTKSRRSKERKPATSSAKSRRAAADESPARDEAVADERTLATAEPVTRQDEPAPVIPEPATRQDEPAPAVPAAAESAVRHHEPAPARAEPVTRELPPAAAEPAVRHDEPAPLDAALAGEPAPQSAIELAHLAGARVAVAGADPASEARLRATLEALGATAVAAEGAASTADIAIVAVPERAELAATLRREPARPVVVASLASAADFDPAAADLFALRPHEGASLAPVVVAALALRERNELIATLRDREERLHAELRRSGRHERSSRFDFFERVLVMEIKRARRFGYSLAVVLVAPDPAAEAPAEPGTLRRVLDQAIASSIRDIDLPIDYADDRVLIVLPYTDHEGARLVGERVARAALERSAAEAAARTVSVGIAALRPGKPVSFSRLMREASAALKAAQLKGGGRVVVRS